MNLSFIIIDDRELDCYIAEKLINKTNLSANNKIFRDAVNALEHIKATGITENKVIILLDVMMPVMNGFEFIEEFDKMPSEITKNYKIVPITTSLNKTDIIRITNYNSVIEVLKKPFTYEQLLTTIETILKEG